ncbi:hypothetical protein D1007_29196 [Hordeum vulgare]|nr:hypothetical protein D1007_29196 [Hordeum vulgare]
MVSGRGKRKAAKQYGVKAVLKGLQIAEKKKCVLIGRTSNITKPSSKTKALENGPWLVGKGLLVIDDFVASKMLDEHAFRSFPIWVSIWNIPLGMMNRETGEQSREAMGECLEVDLDGEDMGIGVYMRIKVKLDIRKPLMRGIRIRIKDDDENNEEGEKEDGEDEHMEEESHDDERKRRKMRFHIDMEIREEGGFNWTFTSMYEEPRAEKKILTWKLMRILHNQASLPWLCAGDFNEVLLVDEKEGGKYKGQACMNRSDGEIDHGALLQTIEKRLTRELNSALMAKFSADEVKATLKDIGDLKARG